MYRMKNMCVVWLVLTGVLHAATITSDSDVFQARDKKMGVLRSGAQVLVLQESGEWMKVRYETMDATFEGYVRRDVVNTNNPGPEAIGVALLEPTAEELQMSGIPASVVPAAATTTPAIAIAPVPETTASPPVRAAQPSRPTVELALSSHWQVQSKSGGIVATDFGRLLADVAKPRVNLAAAKNYVLYRDLYYLMPMDAALREFNQTKVSPVAVTTPGMPVGSFKAYSFDLENDRRFRRMTLVGDVKNQLVAVQLNDAGLKEPWLLGYFETAENKISYTEDMKLFDVVNAGVKGSSNWRVGAVTRSGTNGIVSIDTELVSGPREDLKSRERARLLLPQPVADLCAWMLQNRK